MSKRITIVEVGPRDGLQSESQILPTATKLELISRLARCGLPVVEATSFVNPKRIPQLADAGDLVQQLVPHAGTRFPVLVPNLRGLERALAAGAREVAVFTAASESFSQHNTNCGIGESLERIAAVTERARAAGVGVRAYISCVLGCPYEGAVDSARVTDIAQQLIAMGCSQISLGDTVGAGTPRSARALVEAVAAAVPVDRLAVHFHDTYGQALANILACLETGIRCIDASVAGLGGCPYARGASGNVATEDVVYMLHGMGYHTGVDLQRLVRTGDWISAQLRRPNASKAGVAMLNAKRIEE
jgi:hydroxymethylglutaryl-CoA lyase